MDKLDTVPNIPLDISTLRAALNSTAAILQKYYKVLDSSGAVTIYKLDKKTNLVERAFLDTLYVVVATELKKSGIQMKEKEIKELTKTWLLTAPELPNNIIPRSFTLDPNEYAFNRINLSDISPGETPTWDVFIKKCGKSGEALMAYTWSILDPSLANSQYLFIKGSGGDGKGSYIRWLSKLMGENAVAALSANNPYWPAQLVGRRLGVFNELNSTSLVMKSEFKRITGMDAVDISQKYEKTFTVTLDAKFILTTNLPITVSGDEAERRRAIIINIEKSEDDVRVKNYEKSLEAETWPFLYKCKEAFGRLYDKDNAIILCDYDDFEAEASNYDESNDYMFDQMFEATGNQEDFITARTFQEVLQNKFNVKDGFKISSLKTFMEREHKIKKSRLIEDNKRVWIYRGIKVKAAPSNPSAQAVSSLKKPAK